MLRHYLLNKLFIIQCMIFTLFAVIFFKPQNIFAAYSIEAAAEDTSALTLSIFPILTALSAALLSYILFIIYPKKKLKKRKSYDGSDIAQYMFSLASQSIEASIIMADTAGNIVFLNDQAEELLECSKTEAIGMSLSIFYDAASIQTIRQFSNELHNNKQSCTPAKIRTKTGIWMDVSNLVVPVRSSDSNIIGSIIVLYQCKASEEAAAAAESGSTDNTKPSPAVDNMDMLTRLPNRRLLFEHINTIIEDKEIENRKYALMLINLDFFRSINNNLGYEIGDSILNECADRLRMLFAVAPLLARMDGDEFALIVDIYNPDDIEIAANKIFTLMKEPVKIHNQEIFISVSIGISYFPEQSMNASEIIRNAASSVNIVKNTRRGSYKIYSSDISRYNYKKLNLHSELGQALERSEFILHYQPKTDSKTGQIVGIEALIRWNHPVRGLLYPIDFIPVAEETGIIKYIDEWVLHTACTQLKEWTKEGFENVRLAVNLSAWQFKDQHLASTVSKVLTETGIDPGKLELEITETAALENIDFTQNTMAKLIKMGITISIDDFGTGYSSINYLKNFPINFLKIDKSFVDDIVKDLNTYSIVKAIIDVAHALKLKVIAEGVESQEQLDVLKKLDCDEIQGYLISKPLSAEDIKKTFIREHEQA